MTGIDYVNLVTTVYFYGTSLLIPVTLSIFWSRMTGRDTSQAFSQVSQSVVRCARRSARHTDPLFGIIGLIAASAIVSVVVSLRANTRFDFDSLADGKAALLERDTTAASSEQGTEDPEVTAVDDARPEPAGQQ